MALNINLEDVPNEIFEVVRARILKNRKSRTKAKAPKPKPALKPLPQFKKVGADTKQWKRPEYAVAKRSSVFAWIMQEQKYTVGSESFFNTTGTGYIRTIELHDSKIAASRSISSQGVALNSFDYKVDYVSKRTAYTYYFLGSNPPDDSQLATYGGTIYSKSSLPKDPQYLSCEIISQAKANVVFKFSGSLTGSSSYTSQTPTSVGFESSLQQRYLLSMGLYVPIQNISKPAYLYSFVKVSQTSGLSVLNYGTKLSKLKSTTKYPETVVTGDPNSIYVQKTEITPSRKQKLMELYSQGLLNYTQNPLEQFSFSEQGPMGHIPLYFGDVAGIPETGVDYITNVAITDSKTETYAFDQTVEVIYTEEDYGPLQ